MNDDDRLIIELRRIAKAADPVPEHLYEHARLALDWRTIDAELAELVLDSEDVLKEDELLAVRSTGSPRLLTYEAGELTIELEVEVQDDERRLLRGMVIPGPRDPPGELQVQHMGGPTRTEVDEDGRFELPDIGRGPVKLRVTFDGRRVDTAWAVL